MDFCHPYYHNVLNMLSKYMLNVPHKRSCYEATVLPAAPRRAEL